MEWMNRFWVKVKVFIHKSLNRSLYNNGVIVYGVPKLMHRNKISIGTETTINEGTMLYGRGGITIGRGVSLSYGVCLFSSGYDTTDWQTNKISKHHESLPITIGDYAWIGANTTVLKGVTIAEGCIVGAGSVVTKDLTEPNSLYSGAPAKFVKKLV